MFTTVIGIGCFVSGGFIGATVMAMMVVSKNADEAAELYHRDENY